jgi:predicted AlkP superfamily pyrophosphatase or phosphodiesterase
MRYAPLLTLLALLLTGCAVPLDQQPADRPGGAPSPVTRAGGVNASEHRDRPYVILISFDGFRADYFDRVHTPAFDRVAASGVRAEALIPVFPSKTFPNHYTIATGMYPENHGIVGNSFYDPALDATYSIGDRESVIDGSWYRGEPIWVTAETQGMVAASFFWVGSEADVMGVQPTIWKPYDGRIPNEARVDSVLAWLELPEENRPHVITLYFSNVDSAGHRHGPDSDEVDAAIADTDRVLGRLLDGLGTLPVGDQVYLVIVSDHGMAQYTTETAVAIDDLIDMTGILMADSGPAANLHVEGGSARAREITDQLNARLANGRAYLRQDVPEHLNYRADPRIGDVVVVMEEGWQIRPSDRMPRSDGGTHGWDPTLPSMHGIFLAMGPTVRQGVTIPAFEAVEIYPMLAEILGLRPGPDVDGRHGWLSGRVRQP